jgi:hypothetical protein
MAEKCCAARSRDVGLPEAEFQERRFAEFNRVIRELRLMLLDAPAVLDATFSDQVDGDEFEARLGEWVRSDPVNIAAARGLKKLLRQLEGDAAAGDPHANGHE